MSDLSFSKSAHTSQSENALWKVLTIWPPKATSFYYLTSQSSSNQSLVKNPHMGFHSFLSSDLFSPRTMFEDIEYMSGIDQKNFIKKNYGFFFFFTPFMSVYYSYYNTCLVSNQGKENRDSTNVDVTWFDRFLCLN